MPFNINNFRTNIRDFGYIDVNSFAVLVQTPPFLANAFLGNQGTPTSINKIAENMSFRIDQIRAPGISLISNDVNRYGVGTTQKNPINAQFQEIYFSILADHYCEIWQYWYNWIRGVFEFNGESGGLAASYTARYKDEYSTSLQLQIFDHYGNIVQKINLFEAYPTSLREVPLAWGDPGLLKLNISMAYSEYTIEGSTIQRNTPQTTGRNVGLQRETITAP